MRLLWFTTYYFVREVRSRIWRIYFVWVCFVFWVGEREAVTFLLWKHSWQCQGVDNCYWVYTVYSKSALRKPGIKHRMGFKIMEPLMTLLSRQWTTVTLWVRIRMQKYPERSGYFHFPKIQSPRKINAGPLEEDYEKELNVYLWCRIPPGTPLALTQAWKLGGEPWSSIAA